MTDTVGQALADATTRLAAAGVDSAAHDARALAAFALGCEPLEVGLRRGEPMPETFSGLVARREAREPLQHILGSAWFGPLELKVGPGVFIPRPETEVLADWAVRTAPGGKIKVLDLCSGSGALAAYVAHYLPEAEITAVELSSEALAFTRANLPDRVRLLQADAADPTLLAGERFDLVVSNPPYVPDSPDLAPEVYFDPHEAVFSGASGMELIDAMAPNLFRLLTPGGLVGVEHDDTTSELVQAALRGAGLTEVRPMADLTGRDRFVIGRRAL